MAISRQILYPARLWFILLTIVAGAVINLLPGSGLPFPVLPDALFLVLAYWAVYQSHRIGFLATFLGGLVMDVAFGQVLGQHPLAYVISLFLLLTFQRRFLMLSALQQALNIGGVLLLNAVLIASMRVLGGGQLPNIGWFLPPFVGVLVWPFLVVLLQWPQRRAPQSLA